MSILVCEDNKVVAYTISAILSRAGFKAEVASDGNIAFKLLENNDYKLILLDIHLPYHSGLEIVRHVRLDQNKLVPIIVVSTFSDPQILQQAKELGVNDYIVKPIDPVYLIDRIKSFVNK